MSKLLKYEIHKTSLSKLIILAVTIFFEAIFLIGIVSGYSNGEYIGVGIVGLMFTVILSIFIFGLDSIDKLYKELNSKQSYMLLMTPNSSYKILGAKLLESGIAFLVSGVVFCGLAALDIYLLYIAAGIEGYEDEIIILLQNMTQSQYIFMVIDFILALCSMWFMMITLGYLSVVLQASILGEKRFGAGICFAIYITISIFTSWVRGLIIPEYVMDRIFYGPAISETGFEIYGPSASDMLSGMIFEPMLYYLALAVVFYLIAAFFMDKKLSV